MCTPAKQPRRLSKVTENSSEEEEIKLHVCDSCVFRGIQRTAVFNCKECQERLCTACNEIHNSLKATRGHVVDSLNDAAQGRPTSKPVPAFMRCDEHQTETLTLVCVNHNQLACKLCKITKHRKCTLKTVKEAVEENQDQDEVGSLVKRIRKLMTELEEIKEKRVSDKKDVENCAAHVREKVERIKGEILAWFDKLKMKLEEDLAVKESGLIQEIENDIDTSDQIMKQLQRVISSFESLDDQDHIEKFTLMMKNKQQIEHGESIKEELVQETRPVKFSFSASDRLRYIQSNTQELEKIVHGGLLNVDINFHDITSATKRDNFCRSFYVTLSN